jgi:hypothetical protein
MLRQSWWSVASPAEPLIPALCLMMHLPRDELVRALQARMSVLEANLDAGAFQRAAIRDGATGADGGIPEHVREIMDFVAARTRAELDWARGFQRRLRDGAYRFTGETGFPELGPGKGWPRSQA